MKFKLDENVPAEAALLLRRAGHDAMTVLEQNLGGTEDTRLASICGDEERVLVTFDIGFADIRVYPPETHAGVVVLRLQRQDQPHTLAVLRRLLPLLDQERLTGTLWVVDEERIRIRP
ncbi:MAG: DUF5615 family PIN-like protein [Bacteroidota bacterium]